MFKILQMLRDLNAQRVIRWHVEVNENLAGTHHLVVHIPIDDSDLELLEAMRELFALAED